MYGKGTLTGGGGGAGNQGTTPTSIAPAPPPSPQQQQVQATQVQMQQQQQGGGGGGGGNAGGGQGGGNAGGVQQQQQNVATGQNANMATMSAAAIQQTQMQQQQQQMAPPQAPTPQTLTHPHSAMHQVSEWGHGRVQVIQQPLQNPTYLQQIYNTQGQLLMPGNIALHPAGMNPAIQVIAAGKPFQPNQLAQHMITTQGKSVLQAGQAASFPGYATIPTTSNQTLVISQFLSSQPNILPAHGQGGKPGDMQKIMGGGGKSNVVSSNGMGGGGVGGGVGGAGGGVKGANNQQQQQQQQQCIVSQPQLITTQAPTTAMLGSQAQLISPIQFPWQFGQLPSGITWATSGGLQSPAALLTTNNPIFIRGAQPHDPSGQGGQGPTPTQGGVFIQSPPPQQVATHNPTIAGTPTGMQTTNNASSGTNQGNGNNQQHQAQQAQPQLTHQIHHQHHQLAMKVASVGTNAGRVGGMDGGGTANAGTGTTIQANIQPKTSVANTVLPPRMPNILRPASSVSTQTGSSGGPGGLGMGQLQMQKGIVRPPNQGKVRIKPTMNRASPAPSMKADAANQTKPQPISPANMQHQTQQQQQLAAVAAQVSVSNRMILTSAPTNGAPLLPDKGQQLTLQAVKTFTSSSASTTSTTTSTSTSCSPAPAMQMPLGHPTAVLLPHPSLQAQLMGQATGCPPSPSGNANGPTVSVSSPMRPLAAPTPSGIVTSMPVSMSMAAPPSSPSHQLHQVNAMQHQMMPSMVTMVAAAPSPNQGMQNVQGSSPPVSVVTSSTSMGQPGPVTLSMVTGTPAGMVNSQVASKEETGTSSSQVDVSVGSVGDGGNPVMVVSEERRNGEASPAPGITPMEGVVETGIAPSQTPEDVNGEKEKGINGVAEASVGNTSVSMESASTGEEGSTAKGDSMPVGSSSLANGVASSGTGTLTGMVVGTSRDSHKLPPPKALVKPQVLTHVIEGFVIQEASEPFAVNRSSLLSEMAQPSLKASNQMMPNHNGTPQGAQEKENNQHHLMSNHVHATQTSNESEEPPKKKLMQDVQVQPAAKLPADLAKCEFCGKVDLRSKFKKSKRFCTLACAKRFNVGCSKRSGLYKPEESPSKKGAAPVSAVNSVPVGVSSVPPKDQQGKQDWQKSKNQEWSGNQVPVKPDGSRLCPTTVSAQEENSHTTDNETNDSSGAESSSMSPSEVGQGQESTSARTSGLAAGDPSDDNANSEALSSGTQQNATPSTPPQPRINPIKWTVSDVCEFIRNLPGCSDYAEDFAIQEIDGQALLLLKEDHLMTAMSMKLGPALKICARIDTMRGDMKEK
ncbi:polyhomeotic-like protein 2 isoform X3 [Ischnura elegans]|uniref:polyhomeotic-like protein 2 isoform X3 n=1 Tax=Ischnura elegans TaxID=197161 RepID=UPI001ED8BD49|nr:polyhomeotic-like protein 2 isoform X3 [Ischnura elegans]